MYSDTKCSHPNLKSACDVLEDSFTTLGTAACNRVSPVILKLEPQISIVNDVACKSLTWLETSFPVLLSPTEQIVASAKSQLHGIQDMVSVAASGTVERVQHTVTWAMSRKQPVDDGENRSLAERAVSVASVGLDSALNLSETLMDQVLPPTEEDKEEVAAAAAHSVKGFEAATLRRGYPARLISLTVKLCRRTYHAVGYRIQSVQLVMKRLSRPSALVQDLKTNWLTLVWRLQGLPQYLQHQVASVLFFIIKMFYLGCPPSHQEKSNQVRGWLKAAEASPETNVVQVHLQATPTWRMRSATKMTVFDSGCNEHRCVRH
ncbi:perilipin-2-like [Embiotoca jacksoni]|uniref:perilipin-2-like n=1 Tax=Embiotoca jacksoni TaxID=100190 RepID=UPI003704CFE2